MPQNNGNTDQLTSLTTKYGYAFLDPIRIFYRIASDYIYLSWWLHRLRHNLDNTFERLDVSDLFLPADFTPNEESNGLGIRQSLATYLEDKLGDVFNPDNFANTLSHLAEENFRDLDIDNPRILEAVVRKQQELIRDYKLLRNNVGEPVRAIVPPIAETRMLWAIDTGAKTFPSVLAYAVIDQQVLPDISPRRLTRALARHVSLYDIADVNSWLEDAPWKIYTPNPFSRTDVLKDYREGHGSTSRVYMCPAVWPPSNGLVSFLGALEEEHELPRLVSESNTLKDMGTLANQAEIWPKMQTRLTELGWRSDHFELFFNQLRENLFTRVGPDSENAISPETGTCPYHEHKRGIE